MLLSSAEPDSVACACAANPDISAAIRLNSLPGGMINGEVVVGAAAATAVLETPW
ncbi:Uncharacterised protein [Mycobacteroides abscessus subsp. abscessus]|nr:Uncharacterised protein [Mycobacteroides abscessus subsp. abscessus]